MRQLRSGHSHEDVDQVFGSLSLFLIKHGRVLQTPSAFKDLIERFCNPADRPFEAQRSVTLMDQHRPWNLHLAMANILLNHLIIVNIIVSFFVSRISLAMQFQVGCCSGEIFLAAAVPVMLGGIGGPGAPHHFEISRREDLGPSAEDDDT